MSKRSKVLVGAGAAVLIVGIVVISLGARRDRGQEVRFETVGRRDLVAAVTASGKIQPKKKVDVSADITGRITKIAVHEGDFVKQGQFLIQIDPTIYQASLQQAAANMASAQAAAVQAKANQDQSERALRRTKELHTQSPNLVSQEQLEQAQTAFDIAEANLNAAQHQVDQSRAAVQSARDNLRKTTLIAPMTGRVTRLAVEEGELVCLIGANGAGKTSTLKALCRLIPSRAGTLRYRGENIAASPVHALPRKGLVMVPEGRGIFRQLTVEENLAMGAYALGGGDPEPQYASFPRLRERRKQIAGTLSGGEQQMLAIARALMTRPKLLLLDEPSMGLAPLMVAKIFDIVREIARQGMTILLVEQNARLALELAGRGYVMESGAITLAGTAGDLLNDSKVREAYLGEGVA